MNTDLKHPCILSKDQPRFIFLVLCLAHLPEASKLKLYAQVCKAYVGKSIVLSFILKATFVKDINDRRFS